MSVSKLLKHFGFTCTQDIKFRRVFVIKYEYVREKELFPIKDDNILLENDTTFF